MSRTPFGPLPTAPVAVERGAVTMREWALRFGDAVRADTITDIIRRWNRDPAMRDEATSLTRSIVCNAMDACESELDLAAILASCGPPPHDAAMLDVVEAARRVSDADARMGPAWVDRADMTPGEQRCADAMQALRDDLDCLAIIRRVAGAAK